MSRLESLKKIREVLEKVPAGALGVGEFFNCDGPCCAIGYAIANTPGAKTSYENSPESQFLAAAHALGVDLKDVCDVTSFNDVADEGPPRKAAVLKCLDRLMERET